jgi:hypothetical protein
MRNSEARHVRGRPSTRSRSLRETTLIKSATYVLSQDDMDNPDFGELLRPLILDWGVIALEVEEWGRRIDAISDTEREQLGLNRVASQVITAPGEGSE